MVASPSHWYLYQEKLRVAESKGNYCLSSEICSKCRHLDGMLCLKTMVRFKQGESFFEECNYFEPIEQEPNKRSPGSLVSNCPGCQQTLLRLDDGCGVCGWLPNVLLGDKNKSPSKKVISHLSPKSDRIPTSNNSPSKTRRRKGEGNGSIHWRIINRNGKDYPQAYFHWKDRGKKRTKYIRSHLLEQVIEASEQKRPVVEILQLLGVVQSQSQDELLVGTKNSPSTDEERSPFLASKSSFSKTRREKGLGSGSIQWKTIVRNGKDYPQPWYHYEFWKDGDRLIKKSKYIPKSLLARVQELDAQKVPIIKVLELLGVKL